MKPRHLSDLSPGMVRALIRCSADPVEVLDGPERYHIAAATLAALIRRELVEVREELKRKHGMETRRVYRPTAAGTMLLRDEGRPLYLRARRVRKGTTSAGLTLSRDEMMERAPWGTEEDPGPGARGYTTSPARAMIEDGIPVEAVPLDVLEDFAKDAQERRRGEPGRRREELDRRLRNVALRARQAAKAGDMDALHAINCELDGLERRVEELERARRAA